MKLNYKIYILNLLMILSLANCSTASKHANTSHTKQNQTQDVPADIVGTASWYGQDFQGKYTASGQKFDPHALTAAHQTLPFGTKLLVTNTSNDKQVEVVVNDRGPFIKNRVLDVSEEAAKMLGFKIEGHTTIMARVIQ